MISLGEYYEYFLGKFTMSEGVLAPYGCEARFLV